jgi:mono/diheme cytochrome c family protein
MLFVLSLSIPIVALILVHRSSRSQSLCRIALALTAGIVLASTGTAQTVAASEGDASAREAKALFRRYCLSCHGADGKGDASGAVKGVPDFTRPTWQRKRSDAQLVVSIRDGKGSEMPPFSDRFNEAQVKSLVAHVRGFASSSPGPAPAQPAARETSETSFDVR